MSSAAFGVTQLERFTSKNGNLWKARGLQARMNTMKTDRTPFQILVLPFRAGTSGTFEYAILKRSDHDYWQGIAGGGEGEESPLEAAKRESLEEANIPVQSTFLKLDSFATVPACHFPAGSSWPPETYVIPEYTFGVDTRGAELRFSQEHSELKWCPYEQASRLLKWDSNKNALWELNERLNHHKKL